MALLVAKGIEKSHGYRLILRGCDLILEAGDRAGLVGPNGCGKSTLMQILGGIEAANSGTVQIMGRAAMLAQDPVLPGATVGESAREALSWHTELLEAWQAATEAGDEKKAAAYQAELDLKGWDLDHQVAGMLDRVHAPPPDAPIDRLSGGERRRVALARVLLQAPDVLLLDEPTNHLDADTVSWLEGVLSTWKGVVVFVTHDRYLLEAVATSIVEIEDGVTVSYEGSWADYLTARAERRARLELGEDRRLALMAREAEWASRSPAARSVKQKGRLQRLDALRAARPLRAEETFALDLRTGLKIATLAEVQGVSKAYGERVLFDDVSFTLQRGERLGIMGDNGMGKSTLLGMLAGTVTPDKGRILFGPRVKVGFLDQARSGLDPDATVFEAAGDGNNEVKVGEEWVHVAGFLGRFLFTREHFEQRVHKLSGGERARLLMAKLLLQGAQLLLLDEPTNDLDLTTLAVLEEALLAFDGSAVVVTHDRAFIDRVCNRVLSFDGPAQVVTYSSRLQAVGARERREAEARKGAAAPKATKAAPSANQVPVAAVFAPVEAKKVGARLSFGEKKELEALPIEIERLEAEQAQLEGLLASPETWKARAAEAPAMQARLEALAGIIAGMYARWEGLDARPR